MKIRVKSARKEGGKLPYLLTLDDLPGNFLYQVNAIGDTFDVEDKIGYKLMDIYGDFLELCFDGAPENKMLKKESTKQVSI